MAKRPPALGATKASEPLTKRATRARGAMESFIFSQQCQNCEIDWPMMGVAWRVVAWLLRAGGSLASNSSTAATWVPENALRTYARIVVSPLRPENGGAWLSNMGRACKFTVIYGNLWRVKFLKVRGGDFPSPDAPTPTLPRQTRALLTFSRAARRETQDHGSTQTPALLLVKGYPLWAGLSVLCQSTARAKSQARRAAY